MAPATTAIMADDSGPFPAGTFGEGNELLERAANYLSGVNFMTSVEAWTLDHAGAFDAEEVVDGDAAEASHAQYSLFTAFRIKHQVGTRRVRAHPVLPGNLRRGRSMIYC